MTRNSGGAFYLRTHYFRNTKTFLFASIVLRGLTSIMSENEDMTDESKQKFYQMMDSIAETANPIEQNKRIKEAEFAEDSREPTAKETAAIRQEIAGERDNSKLLLIQLFAFFK